MHIQIRLYFSLIVHTCLESGNLRNYSRIFYDNDLDCETLSTLVVMDQIDPI